ncbi:hypothetical protein RI367_006493 [Sorochytrium milnesiophthora]
MPMALKWLGQLHEGVPTALIDLWCTVAALTRRLYQPRIHRASLAAWSQALQQLITQYVNQVAALEGTRQAQDSDEELEPAHTPRPTVPQTRLKDHLLLHAPSAVGQWGPLTMWHTERFESANGAVRRAIQNTNRHDISRDVARHFAQVECAVFLSQGGTWLLNEQRVSSAEHVRRSFEKASTHDTAEQCSGSSVTAVRTSRAEWVYLDDWVTVNGHGGMCLARVCGYTQVDGKNHA